MSRIHLSPPDVTARDRDALIAALDGGWVAPVGPDLDRFEADLAAATGRSHAVGLSSGTAALHLALVTAGIGPGDRVLVSSLTFAATANAVRYVGAEPVFVDSEADTWNMDPELVAQALDDAAAAGERYAACIPVDLYGQCVDYDRLTEMCDSHDVPIFEDAAEALGARYGQRPAGSFGDLAVLSFNGNKIITTSGGGALVTDSAETARQARFLATQAREPVVHYEHTQLGYNYRLSNLLAGLGISQLADLERRVDARRAHNRAYREALGDLPGVEFMPEAPGSRSTFWLTCLTIDPAIASVDREDVRLHLDSLDIEARPVWKPMHLQPLYTGARMYGGAVSAGLFERGLCLPSGSSLKEAGRQRVIDGVRAAFAR
ncbi:MAG: aminotransferase class I/II-fold pyridoxal phosphate-dependent enzyme [Acidimicrobiia bacterium]